MYKFIRYLFLKIYIFKSMSNSEGEKTARNGKCANCLLLMKER
jgi:hypothetical protein